MQSDYEIYVDPEEDEIFFRCLSEKEKKICPNFVQQEAPELTTEDVCKANELSNSGSPSEAPDKSESGILELNDLINKKSADDSVDHESETSFQDANSTFGKSLELKHNYSNNTTIDLEHSYSNSTKQKIDKTILATPKSIVKADRDGGFLKVLSEIALVKAEAEADKKINEEDKENKIIPKIRIIEATPEKENSISPPKSNSSNFRRFRIIYNSPNNEENVEINKAGKLKSNNDNFENTQNLKNKILDYDSEENILNDIINNDKVDSVSCFDLSVHSVDSKPSNNTSHTIFEKLEKQAPNEASEIVGDTTETDNDPNNDSDIIVIEEHLSNACEKEFEGKIFSENVKYLSETSNQDKNATKNISDVFENKSDIKTGSPKIIKNKLDVENVTTNPNSEILLTCEPAANEIKSPVINNFVTQKNNLEENLMIKIISKEENENAVQSIPDSKTNIHKPLLAMPIPGYRFSKEARKVIEVLKNSAADDTLNFTVQVIDVENTENSFLSPESVSFLNETVLPSKSLKTSESVKKGTPKTESRLPLTKVFQKPKTVEKGLCKATPIFQSKIQPLKYFSDGKIYNKTETEVKKCVKKLPLDGKKVTASEEEIKLGKTVEIGSKLISSTKIPVCSSKSSKIPLSRLLPHSASKISPGKTSSGKIYRNPKFKNIESPINAYIHNKPTSLVVNVKPEANKDRVIKLWKTQTVSTEKKYQDKKKVESSESEPRLPFVEYRSGTPFQVEKRSESRLPRLAPTVQKLIGSHSPKILKHEGRFYIKTPLKKVSKNDSTISTDPNEVSVVVSQAAQKSNTIN